MRIFHLTRAFYADTSESAEAVSPVAPAVLVGHSPFLLVSPRQDNSDAVVSIELNGASASPKFIQVRL